MIKDERLSSEINRVWCIEKYIQINTGIAETNDKNEVLYTFFFFSESQQLTCTGIYEVKGTRFLCLIILLD